MTGVDSMTRGEQMLALRKQRMAEAPPLLRGGFRPFFFCGALWALSALVLWLCALAGQLALPTHFDPIAWHRHEMLFGFVGAVVAGFLLTAIPNWTGRLPIAGPPLLALVAFWAAARLALLFSSVTGPLLPAVLDAGFYLVMAGIALREVLAAKNRNVPIVGLIALFGFTSAADHAAAAGLIGGAEAGAHAGMALVVIMISLIGGRIIPSFTRNWLAKQGAVGRLPTQPGRFDMGAIALTAVALLLWVLGSTAAGVALLVVAALQLVRLGRWGGERTFSDPLVLILHIGYLWVPVGLGLLGASELGMAVPRSAGIHALTAGAMGTMVLAVMTRATLGHTGRPLKASGATVLLYGLVTAGAVLRVAAALGAVDYTDGMRWSAVAWGAAFLTFLIAYGPILFRPRLGQA
jgi:uncharacterized protein involved in response to NO